MQSMGLGQGLWFRVDPVHWKGIGHAGMTSLTQAAGVESNPTKATTAIAGVEPRTKIDVVIVTNQS